MLSPVSAANIEVDMIVVNAPKDGRVDFTFTVHRDDYDKARELVGAVAAQHAGAQPSAQARKTGCAAARAGC